MKKLKFPAFTLVEVLVSMVITGIMLTLATSSYWVFLKTNMKTEVSRDLQQEMRFALTRITDRMRAYSVDYRAYEVAGKCHIGNINQQICFHENSFLKYEDDPDGDPNTEDEMLYLEDQPLFSPKKFKVIAFHSDFSPKINPYDPTIDFSTIPEDIRDIQMQPKATFFIEVGAKDERFENIKLQLQTTISSRKYNS